MPRPLRVLLAHNYYRRSAPSGENSAFDNECALLAGAGVDVIPFTSENDALDASGPLRAARVAIETVWSHRSYEALGVALRRDRPDLVHFHNTFPQYSPSVYAACRKARVPVVQTLHNFRLVCPSALLLRDGKPCEKCLEGSLLNAVRYRCYRDSAAATSTLAVMIAVNRALGSYDRNVDRYIALTEFAASRLKAGGLPQDRMAVKPNCLPHPPSAGKGGGGYAVYVGRLSGEKGLATLFDAWRGIDLPLKIVGDGPLRSSLERMVDTAGLKITVLGLRSQKEVHELMRAAEFLVLPSECYEGFPMVALEALACGTPIVASNIGSMMEIVDEGVTGFKFAAGNASHLQRLVHRLLGAPAELARMRHTARQVFDDRYAPEKNVAQLLAIYDNVLRRL